MKRAATESSEQLREQTLLSDSNNLLVDSLMNLRNGRKDTLANGNALKFTTQPSIPDDCFVVVAQPHVVSAPLASQEKGVSLASLSAAAVAQHEAQFNPQLYQPFSQTFTHFPLFGMGRTPCGQIHLSTKKVFRYRTFTIWLELSNTYVQREHLTTEQITQSLMQIKCFKESAPDKEIACCTQCSKRPLIEIKETNNKPIFIPSTNSIFYTYDKCRSNCSSSRDHHKSNIFLVLDSLPNNLISSPPFSIQAREKGNKKLKSVIPTLPPYVNYPYTTLPVQTEFSMPTLMRDPVPFPISAPVQPSFSYHSLPNPELVVQSILPSADSAKISIKTPSSVKVNYLKPNVSPFRSGPVIEKETEETDSQNVDFSKKFSGDYLVRVVLLQCSYPLDEMEKLVSLFMRVFAEKMKDQTGPFTVPTTQTRSFSDGFSSEEVNLRYTVLPGMIVGCCYARNHKMHTDVGQVLTAFITNKKGYENTVNRDLFQDGTCKLVAVCCSW